MMIHKPRSRLGFVPTVALILTVAWPLPADSLPHSPTHFTTVITRFTAQHSSEQYWLIPILGDWSKLGILPRIIRLEHTMCLSKTMAPLAPYLSSAEIVQEFYMALRKTPLLKHLPERPNRIADLLIYVSQHYGSALLDRIFNALITSPDAMDAITFLATIAPNQIDQQLTQFQSPAEVLSTIPILTEDPLYLFTLNALIVEMSQSPELVRTVRKLGDIIKTPRTPQGFKQVITTGIAIASDPQHFKTIQDLYQNGTFQRLALPRRYIQDVDRLTALLYDLATTTPFPGRITPQHPSHITILLKTVYGLGRQAHRFLTFAVNHPTLSSLGARFLLTNIQMDSFQRLRTLGGIQYFRPIINKLDNAHLLQDWVTGLQELYQADVINDIPPLLERLTRSDILHLTRLVRSFNADDLDILIKIASKDTMRYILAHPRTAQIMPRLLNAYWRYPQFSRKFLYHLTQSPRMFSTIISGFNAWTTTDLTLLITIYQAMPIELRHATISFIQHLPHIKPLLYSNGFEMMLATPSDDHHVTRLFSFLNALEENGQLSSFLSLLRDIIQIHRVVEGENNGFGISWIDSLVSRNHLTDLIAILYAEITQDEVDTTSCR